MTPVHLIILLVTGIVAGFAGGLLGVGGGFLMTPVQYVIYTGMGLPADTAIKLAFGTNLLVVLPLAASGVWRHNRKGTVRWKPAVVMGLCGTAISFGGATLAARLPGEALKIAFGVVILFIAVRLLTARLPETGQKPVDNPWLWVAWVVPIGLLTGILGLGGGVLAVPVMALALRFKMHEAVATSLGIMLFTSTGGIIGYIVNGIGVPGLPPYSIGYINLLSWLPLAIGSVAMVQLGAITAHKLPARQLKYIFALVMLYISMRMLGVFAWLGWPL